MYIKSGVVCDVRHDTVATRPARRVNDTAAAAVPRAAEQEVQQQSRSSAAPSAAARLSMLKYDILIPAGRAGSQHAPPDSDGQPGLLLPEPARAAAQAASVKLAQPGGVARAA